MDNLIVLGLQQLGLFLDRLVPMQGGRTMLIAGLGILWSLSGFLTGKTDAHTAAHDLPMYLGIIFASLHTPPTPPLHPPTP